MNNKNLSIKETLNLAFKNHKENNFAVAENLYSKVLKIDPNNFDAIFLLGSLWFQMKNYSDAIRMLTNAINLKPKNINSYQNLGALLLEIGESQKAAQVLAKASMIQPDNSGVLYNLGNAYKNLGQLEKAVSCYKKAIKIEPRNTKAQNNLGNVYKSLRENKKAIEVFKKTLDIEPNHINANHNLANTYKETGDFSKAKDFYKKSFEINSNLESLHALSELDEKILNISLKEKIDKIISNKGDNYANLAYGNFLLSKYELKNNNLEKEFNYLIEAHSLYFLSKKDFYQKGINYWLNQLPKNQELTNFNFISNDNNNIKPIFIIGVPRCGSTLIEKIIASGSQNIPMGEEIGVLNFVLGKRIIKKQNIIEDIATINKEILDLYKERGLIDEGSNYTFTDKTLDNFFFIGLIKNLFPKAKIINCRRNPISSILSIMKNNLGGVSWAHKLENIFQFFDVYYKKIETFKSLYPNFIYDLELENFTKNPETESKKLMKYCELAWDKKCLEFYKRKDLVSRTASNVQIRKPIFDKSSSKVDPYKAYLEKYGKKYSWFN